MGYRPTSIEVTRLGRYTFIAKITEEDDGLPDEECPVHGWDGPVRDEDGVMKVGARQFFGELAARRTQLVRNPMGRCVCSHVPGEAIERGAWTARTHERAFRKALRAAGGKLWPVW